MSRDEWFGLIRDLLLAFAVVVTLLSGGILLGGLLIWLHRDFAFDGGLILLAFVTVLLTAGLFSAIRSERR